MVHIGDIPQEILNLIVRLLGSDARALLNLCLTSHRFTHEAQVHLYSDIRVGEKYTIEPLCIDVGRFAKLSAIFTTHNPALASYVNCFAYAAFISSEEHDQRILQRTLRLMNNTTTLVLNPHNAHQLPKNLFDGCTFQLTQFHFDCCMPQNLQLLSFPPVDVRPQSLYDLLDSIDFPPNCFSSLKTLCTDDWNHAFRILAEFPDIRRLDCEGPYRMRKPPPIVPDMFQNITVFVYKDLYDYKFFEDAVPYLSRLRVLCLVGFLSISTIRQNPESITKLTQLVVFIWTKLELSGRWTQWGFLGSAFHLDLVKIWFQKMPRLRKAYFQHDCKDDTKNYACWRRNEAEPTLVSHSDVVEGNGISDLHLMTDSEVKWA